VKKSGPEATDEDFRKEAKEVKNDEAMNYTTMSVMVRIKYYFNN